MTARPARRSRRFHCTGTAGQTSIDRATPTAAKAWIRSWSSARGDSTSERAYDGRGTILGNAMLSAAPCLGAAADRSPPDRSVGLASAPLRIRFAPGGRYPSRVNRAVPVGSLSRPSSFLRLARGTFAAASLAMGCGVLGCGFAGIKDQVRPVIVSVFPADDQILTA